MAANVLMAILADFMLVWLPAPTYALAHKQVGRAGCGAGLASGAPSAAAGQEGRRQGLRVG